ncbi:type IV pilus biogenesis/stability protein PilW [Alteromonas sediminis]|uniref:Type IV pilus biogenesis/stability protein PilW n=1 Tax=Alteromonas sediminis TaxID=2259342 RepID=A0A3N5XYK0_9ALTE|nr:type IV pilus biogenesis/stability protein PilW [Alteromonas sediminis]RPJ65660.1 type IV pilus biogenesis/stability protein PilW [Alteromonas sediminis]
MRYLLVLAVFLLSGCVSQTTGGFSEEMDYEEAARTRISLGLTYLRNGNFTQAKQNLDKALDFAPRLADSHYSLAYYFQVVGENERADEFFNNALKIEPRNPELANSYGAFLCQQNNYQKAKEYFNRAVASVRYANSAETYENMAICAEQEGYTEEAIAYLRSALNHQPGRMKTLTFLTELYMKNGNFKEAGEVLDRMERLGRVDDTLLWLRMDLARQQGDTETMTNYGDMLASVYPNSPLTKDYKDAKAKIRPVVVTRTKKVEPQISTEPLERKPESSTLAETETQTRPDYHIVDEGENLFRISVMYNITMQRLIEWNELSDAGAIRTGMKLWLVPSEERP